MNLQYVVKTSSGWQAREPLTDIDANQYAASIAVDSLDNVHVVWSGYGWGEHPYSTWKNIQHRVRDASGWQPQEALTEHEYHQNNPNLIWAEWPDPPMVRTNVPETGFALVYSGKESGDPWDKEYNVTYYYSDDLTWGTKPVEVEAVGGILTPVNPLGTATLWLILCVLGLTVLVVKQRHIRY